MNVLVTGGAGFIGSHVARLLVAQGASVTVFDALVAGSRENVPVGAGLIVGDIRDQNALAIAMRDVTHVVHLAAQISVVQSMENPEETNDINVEGTHRVFSAAQRSGVTKIVYASSAAVYGNTGRVPNTETDLPAPASPYASSKVANEAEAAALTRAGLACAGLRFFNVYGPGQRNDSPYSSVIARWARMIKSVERLVVYGDGSQSRDFIHVDDVARAVSIALERPTTTGVYNIASGTETSLNELRALFEKAIGHELEVDHRPAREGDILRSVADVSKAQNELGFQARIALSKGVHELLS